MSEYPIDRRRLLRTAGAGLVGSGLFAAGSSAQAADRTMWEFETDGRVLSSPTVIDDTVYVGSDSLFAVDLATGDRRWVFETGQNVTSPPTVADDTVYAGSADGSLYAVDAATGDHQWEFETGDWVFGSPAVNDGTVYAGSLDFSLYAINAATGHQQWEFETRDQIFSSPTVVDGTVYVGSHGGSLHAVDATTGDHQWEFEIGDGVFSSPTVVDGMVYVGSFDNSLYKVDIETGDLQWAFETEGSVSSSPTVANGTAYVGSLDGSLYAVDAATGNQQWEFETGDGVISSPTVVDNTVYVGSRDNSLYAVNVATGEQEWAFETGDRIRSSPTVVDGIVYIGSWDDSLYALEADTDGSSEGSRVRLETLGHHDRTLFHVSVDYAPRVPAPEEPITFDGSATQGPVETYTWAFGDGTTATGDTATHSYDEPGEYDVTLSVEGPDGGTDSATTTVPVGQPSGTLSVSTTPPDATVLVDGDPLESRTVDRLPGTYEVTAAHDEHGTETESATVEADETTTVEFPFTSLRIGDDEPLDTTGDGLYNDFDGDGETTHDDVTAFFEHLESDGVQNNPNRFDFDDNDRIGFADVIELLRRV